MKLTTTFTLKQGLNGVVVLAEGSGRSTSRIRLPLIQNNLYSFLWFSPRVLLCCSLATEGTTLWKAWYYPSSPVTVARHLNISDAAWSGHSIESVISSSSNQYGTSKRISRVQRAIPDILHIESFMPPTRLLECLPIETKLFWIILVTSRSKS